MTLDEVVQSMRRLGVRRVVLLGTKGDVAEAELFGRDRAPEWTAPAPTTDGNARPMDPGELQAVTRMEARLAAEKAAAKERAYHDSILFAATGYEPPGPILTGTDE